MDRGLGVGAHDIAAVAGTNDAVVRSPHGRHRAAVAVSAPERCAAGGYQRLERYAACLQLSFADFGVSVPVPEEPGEGSSGE